MKIKNIEKLKNIEKYCRKIVHRIEIRVTGENSSEIDRERDGVDLARSWSAECLSERWLTSRTYIYLHIYTQVSLTRAEGYMRVLREFLAARYTRLVRAREERNGPENERRVVMAT